MTTWAAKVRTAWRDALVRREARITGQSIVEVAGCLFVISRTGRVVMLGKTRKRLMQEGIIKPRYVDEIRLPAFTMPWWE